MNISKLTGRTLSIEHKRYLQLRLATLGWKCEQRFTWRRMKYNAWVSSKPMTSHGRQVYYSILSAARAAGIKTVPC